MEVPVRRPATDINTKQRRILELFEILYIMNIVALLFEKFVRM